MVAWILLLACSGGDADSEVTPYVPPEQGEIALLTRDEVELVADLYPASDRGRPAIVLLHMVPPSWDRTSWPIEFVERLHAHDWHVLVLDRRGAGESGGVAEDAYIGEAGRYDVEAAALYLAAIEAGDLAILGASNGTTSMVDYAAWAPEEALPEPVSLGFMTGGDYTENQTAMGDVPSVPAVFTYSTEESEWSLAQVALDPGTWVFHEYPDGDHGTKMFDAAPEVADDLDAFFAGVLD